MGAVGIFAFGCRDGPIGFTCLDGTLQIIQAARGKISCGQTDLALLRFGCGGRKLGGRGLIHLVRKKNFPQPVGAILP